MADLTLPIEGLQNPILLAEVREAGRACFRSMDARNVLIVDVDSGDEEEAALGVLDAFVASHPSLWRAYRTARGLRFIELSSIWTPRSGVVKAIMDALGADPAYVASWVLAFRPGLERGTFSARIDPKPWNMDGGYTRAELRTMADEDFAIYQAAYAVDKLGYRVADFLALYGDEELPVHSWAAAVVDYHDAQGRVGLAELELA